MQPIVKPLQSLDQRKSIALLRPAQKGLKTILAGGNTNTTTKSSSTIPSADAGAAKKTFGKRHTIFKDTRLDVVQETEIAPQELGNTKFTSPKDNNVESTKRNGQPQACVLPPPLPLPVSAEPVKEPQHPESDSSLPGIEEVSLGPTLSSEPSKNGFSLNDFITSAAEPVAPSLSFQHRIDHASSIFPPPTSDTNAPAGEKTESQQIPIAKLVNPVTNIPPLSPHHTYIQRQIDQEEYWDEEDEENYEEEGYVTARSFRSRGENTTGGATTILFPQMNQRVRKEISAAKQLVEATRSPEEIEDESYDTSMVAEYGEEIFDYMQQLELKMLPNAHYMENQQEIQWSMRSVLMDWLVQVHLRFNLLPETLFLCVNYIDRFLSCKVVSLGKLQLVGATAIFIAAKYEEINCPSVQEIVYMVDGGYTIDEILKAERFMLTMLQFELGWPGPMSFLRRISKADDYDLETRTLAKYFLEVTLMDERFIGSPPSFTAAASHCLSRIMLRKGIWVSSHLQQTLIEY